MRITFAVANYAPSEGGAQEYVRQVAEGLVLAGHEVDVVTTDALRSSSSKDPGRIGPRHEQVAGVAVDRAPVVSLLRRMQRSLRVVSRRLPGVDPDPLSYTMHPVVAGPMAPGLWRQVWRAARRRDVVVGCSAPFLTMILPPLLRPLRGGGARIVALPLLHSSRSEPSGSVRRALRRCDASAAATTFERQVQTDLGLAPGRVALLPPGTDPDEFPEIDRQEARRRLGLPERPTVGYVGRLAAYKGVDTLLDAAVELWAEVPELTVLVAGARTGWSGHRDHAANDLGAGRLVIREDFATEDRAVLLAACDVVAFPSRDESFGLGIVEAWSARRPVVAADIPAVRTVVRDGVDGILVPVDDPTALAAGIGRLLGDADLADRLGAAGRRHVEADLSWTAIVRRWDVFLRAVHDRAPDPAALVAEAS